MEIENSIQIVETINNLKSKLQDFSKTEIYKQNRYSKSITAAIVIAISLTELKLYQDRNITKEEEKWFDGGYQISREFDSDGDGEIYDLYNKVVKFMTK